MQNDAHAQQSLSAPAHPKDYSGRFVVTHTVERGQTLSKIARIYLRPTHQPLWIYNSRIARTIADENEIRTGARIFIPRSREGYERLIRRLNSVRDQMEMQGKTLGFELDGLQNNYKAATIAIDGIADVATTIASFAFKAVEAAKMTLAAESAARQAKIAAHHAARGATRDFAKAYTSARSRLLGKALQVNAKAVRATDAFREARMDKFVDIGAEQAEETNTKNVLRIALLARKAARGAATIGSAADTLVGVLQDYLKPSVIAEAVLVCIAGETTEQSIEASRKTVERNTDKMMEHVSGLIETYEDECKLLYG